MNIREKTITGVKWTTINSVVIVLFGLIKISVLTRFLDKSDFGLMALVLFILGFVAIFMDVGITTAILFKQNISKEEYATLYWFNFGISIILYLILLVITPILSNFYNEPELKKLIPIMGITVIIKAIGTQFRTIEIKNLRFKLISIVEIVASFISLIIAVVMAILHFGVYSLVYSALIQVSISNLIFLFNAVKNGTFKFYFNLVESIPFLKIGIYNLGEEVINFFNRDVDLLLIGKIFGVEMLGGYSLAKQLVIRPYSVINPILITVASPVLALYQGNIKSLNKNYLTLIKIISSVNIPIYILIIIFASPIVNIVYGVNYQNIVVLIRILSVFMIFRAIHNPNGSLIIATGKTRLGFYWNLVTIPFVPITVYLGSRFGIQWTAVLLTLITAVLVIPGSWYFLINKMSGATFKEYVVAMIPNPIILLKYWKSHFRNNNLSSN